MKAFTSILLLCMLLSINNNIYAKTITLDKDTKLVPLGWTVADDTKFKKDTIAEINEDWQIIQGTLAASTYLRPTGWRNLINNNYYAEATTNFFPPRFFRPFPPRYGVIIPADGHVRYKGNTSVTFKEDGTVLSGTIDNDVVLQLNENGYGFVTFKNDTVLTFYPDGKIKSGTLAESTKLRPLGWQNNLTDENAGFLEFKNNSFIIFTEDGFVKQGLLKSKKLWYNADGSSQNLENKVSLNFTEKSAEETK